MSTTVTYKGNTLATVENATKTLKTAGKYMEGDVVLTDVSSSAPTLQAKTNISPTTSSQTITPDTGYDGLSSVQINAMPNGSAIAPATISGTDATVSKSTNSITLSKSIPVTPLVTPGYVASGSIRNCDVSLTVPTAETSYPVVSKTINADHTATLTANLNTSNVNSYGTYYLPGIYSSRNPSTIAASELVSGTLSITANGTADVTNYASVDVNVQSGGGASISVSPYTLRLAAAMPMSPTRTVSALRAVENGGIVYFYFDEYSFSGDVSALITDPALIDGWIYFVVNTTDSPMDAYTFGTIEPVEYTDYLYNNKRLFRLKLTADSYMEFM